MNVEDQLRAAGAALGDADLGVVPPDADQRRGMDPDDAADAAELGEAAYILGVHYLEAGNLPAASRWLLTAAQRDIGDAALRLALVLQASNDPQATHWFRVAEQVGYAVDDVDQLDTPELPLTCCPSPADDAVTADALQRAEATIRMACAEADRIVADAHKRAQEIAAEARRRDSRLRPSSVMRGARTHPEGVDPLAVTLLTMLATNAADDHWPSLASFTTFKKPHHVTWQRLLSKIECVDQGEVWSSVAAALLDREFVQPLAVRSTYGNGGSDGWLFTNDAGATAYYQLKSTCHRDAGAPQEARSDSSASKMHSQPDGGDARLGHRGSATVADTSTIREFLAAYPHEVMSVATKVSQVRPAKPTDDGEEQRTELAAFEVLIGAAPA
jgi:hypothetical protein